MLAEVIEANLTLSDLEKDKGRDGVYCLLPSKQPQARAHLRLQSTPFTHNTHNASTRTQANTHTHTSTGWYPDT